MGQILSLFIVCVIDSALFPVLPELFMILIFSSSPGILWGITLIIAALLGAVFGNCILYFTVKSLSIPSFIEKKMIAYKNFLFVSDERILFLNTFFVPVLPLTGAFIAVSGWDVKKAFSYLVSGALLKYCLMISLSNFFYTFMESGMAQKFSLIMVFCAITISLISSKIYRTRHPLNKETIID